MENKFVITINTIQEDISENDLYRIRAFLVARLEGYHCDPPECMENSTMDIIYGSN